MPEIFPPNSSTTNINETPPTVKLVKDPKYPHITYRVVLSTHNNRNTLPELGNPKLYCIEEVSASVFTPHIGPETAIRRRFNVENQLTSHLKVVLEKNIPIYYVDMWYPIQIEQVFTRRRFLIKLFLFGGSSFVTSLESVFARVAGHSTQVVLVANHIFNNIDSPSAEEHGRGTLYSKLFLAIENAKILTVDKYEHIKGMRDAVLAYKIRLAGRSNFSNDINAAEITCPLGYMHYEVENLLALSDEDLLKILEERLLKFAKQLFKIDKTLLIQALATVPIIPRVTSLRKDKDRLIIDTNVSIDENLKEVVLRVSNKCNP